MERKLLQRRQPLKSTGESLKPTPYQQRESCFVSGIAAQAAAARALHTVKRSE